MDTKVAKTIAFIPARGGSKSIPFKNVKLIAGKPLIQWVIEAACNCNTIQEVYISTDSDLIRNTIEQMKLKKVKVIGRSAETANDTASSESALLEFAKECIFDNMVFIQATSPLLKSEDLTNALEKYHTDVCDSLLSVVRQKRFLWEEEGESAYPLNYDPYKRPRRQDFNGFLVENGAFYITSRENLLSSKCRISGRISCYEMCEESYFEIDEPSDWLIIGGLLKQREYNTAGINQKAKKIRMLVTDVDGVLTDSGMYYSEFGDELKKFNTKDGMGVALLRNAGIRTCIVTGEKTDLVRRRAAKLGIDELYLGIENKLDVLNMIAKKYCLELYEIAYIGDDTNDLEVIANVGLGCCVSDAMECIQNVAAYITHSAGGEGALREVAELILATK